VSAPTVARGTEGVSPESSVDPSADGQANVAEANRYPGSPPFGDTAIDRLLFRGRARETDEVLHSVLSYDLFLVYAVSGMGKTSLLTAGVLEPLRQRGYFPVMLRVNSPNTPMLALIEAQIREAAALAGVEIDRTPAVRADAPPSTTLWDMLAELEIWRGNTLQQLVLVFDQFEELFTLPWSQNARAEFIEQFGEVVRHHRVPGHEPDSARQALPPPNVKIVLCMREDFIGQLEALAVPVPQILQRRFRLGALDPVQAEAAIREPAAIDDPRLRTRRFAYTAGAATTMLTFLRTRDERGTTVLTDSIDPSQLQIICQHVERSILPGKAPNADGVIEITENDLGGQDGLRRIVGDFYRHVLETFDARDRRSLRRLCETGFISQSGRRLSLEEGEITSHFDVSRDTLRELVDLRLLRSEPRLGSVYYELAHDTLTGPILAYRDARRRARRRRIAIALISLAALAAVVVAVALVSRQRTEGNAAAPAPATPIDIGEEVSDELSTPEDTAAYEVTATDQPLVVELRPFGFNGVLEVAPIGTTGSAQTQDVGLLGAPEFAVLGAGTGHYRIDVSGAEPGTFELVVRPANTRRLATPGDVKGLRLPSTGEPTVFELTGSDDQAFAASVFAKKGDAATDMPRGVFVQIVAPDGATTQVSAEEGSNLISTIGGGDAGTYLLAIGDSSGDTKTTYDVAVRPARITPVPIGGSADARLTGAEPQAVFDVQSTAGGALFFELHDRQGGSFGQVQTPDGAVAPLDPTTFTLVSGGAGRYLIVVSSDIPDIVSLSVDAAEGVPVELGEQVTGTLDDTHSVALYRVQTGDTPVVAKVTSDATLDAVLSLVDTADSTVNPIDFTATDAAEEMVLTDGIADSQLLAVTAYDNSSGAFEFSVTPIDSQPIEIGNTVTRQLGAGELALYNVTATGDTPFAVAVSSADGLGAGVSITDPSGALFDQGGSFFVSDGAPGAYTITARNVNEPGTYFVSVAPLHELPDNGAELSVEGTIDGQGDIEAFALPVVDDPLTFVTIATDGDLEVDAAVTDALGNVIVESTDTANGINSIMVPGSSGSDRLIVTGLSGGGSFRAVARGLTPIAVAPDGTETLRVTKPGDAAAYSLGASDHLLDVVVQPSDGVTANVTVIDSVGNIWPTEQTDSTSPDTLFPDTRDGPVQVVVAATGGQGGVAIRSNPIETSRLAIGEAQRGSIRSPGQVLAFEVQVDDEAQYTVNVSPSSRFDPQISMLDPYGQFSSNDGFGEGELETLSMDSGSGVYRIIVSGAGPSIGGFEIDVEPTE